MAATALRNITGPLQQQTFIAVSNPSQYRNLYGASDNDEAVFQELPKATRVARSITDDFNRQVEQYERGKAFIKAGVEVSNAFIHVGAAGAGGLGGIFVGAAATAGINYVKDWMFKKRSAAITEKLKLELERFRNQHGSLDAFNVQGKDDTEKAKIRYNLLYGKSHPVTTASYDFDAINDKGKVFVQNTLIKMLADVDKVLATELADQGKQLKKQGQTIAATEETISQIDKTFYKFKNDTFERVTKVSTDLQELQNDLQQLSQNTTDPALALQNCQRINTLQMVLFDKMNPEEKLDALDKGLLDHLPDETRQQIKKREELAAKQKKIIHNMMGFVNAADDLLAIASNLGVKIPPFARQATGIAAQAIRGGVAFLSGNFFDTLSAISSIIGIGTRKDVDLERHKQVMSGLDQLAQGQNVIVQNQKALLQWSYQLDKKTDFLLQNQQTLFQMLVALDENLQGVLQNQEQIVKNICSLSEQIERCHATQMQHLAHITYDLALIRLNLRSNALEKLKKCHTALVALFKFPNYVKTVNCFRSPEDFIKYYQRFSPDLTSGLNALKNKLPFNPTVVDTDFFAVGNIADSSYEKEKTTTVTRYYHDLKELALQLLHKLPQENKETFFASLLQPVQNAYALQKKLQILQKADREQRLPARFRQLLDPSSGIQKMKVETLLGEWYSFELIIQSIEYAYRFHYFLPFSQGGLSSLEDLEKLSNQELFSPGKKLLEDAISRLEIVIAQHALLSGDALLPLFFDVFEKPQSFDKEIYKSTLERLDQNYQLAHNFLLYFVIQKAHSMKSGFFKYPVAVLKGDEQYLREILGHQIPLRWDEIKKEWHVEFGERKDLTLPTSSAVSEGKFLINSELKELFHLHKLLAQEILGYNYPQHLDTDLEKRLYFQALSSRVEHVESEAS